MNKPAVRMKNAIVSFFQGIMRLLEKLIDGAFGVLNTLKLNVLVIIGGGYLTVAIVFLSLISTESSMSVEDAYSVIQAPLMALVGGSLAIAKDLIKPPADD